MDSLSNPDRRNGHNDYTDRIGELVTGFIKRFDGEDIIVDLGKLDAVLPHSQQSRHERWHQGERIRVVITNVTEGSKLQVEVSRTLRGFNFYRLFPNRT